jgi:hypothetical protein
MSSDYGWREFHYQRLIRQKDGQQVWKWTWFRVWGTTRLADQLLSHMLMWATCRNITVLEITDQSIYTAPQENRNG